MRTLLANTPRNFVHHVSGKHTVLFYEDTRSAEAIESQFLLDGFRKKEPCLFTTHGGTETIRNALQENGIDVGFFESAGLLKVVRIPNPADSLEVRNLVEDIKSNLLAGLTGAYRIVSRLIEDVEKSERMALEMRAEKAVQAVFQGKPKPVYDFLGGRGGSFMCVYPVRRLRAENGQNIIRLIQTHQSVLFAPGKDGGIGLDMR